MSDGWQNPVIGGAGTLLRAAIRSPDYAAGVDGWSINRDGTAEFNDATFRGSVVIDNATEAILVYDGPPALGNLIYALSNTQGTDTFGNGYAAGVTLPAETGSAKSGALRWKQPAGNVGTTIGEILAFTGADPRVEIWARNASRLLFQYAPGSAGLQFGAGPTGRYYAESQFYGPQAFATGGALKNLSLVEAFTVHGNDYAAGVGFDITGVTGKWVAPESGLFHASLVIAFDPDWAPATAPMAELRLGIRNMLRAGQPLVSQSNMSGVGRGIMDVDMDIIKGDTYQAQVFHSMGSTANLAATSGGTAQASRWTMRRYL